MSNIKMFHRLIDMMRDLDRPGGNEFTNFSYNFDPHNFIFQWCTDKFIPVEGWWEYTLQFPDLETMMAYINQQIEIHEQFLARFSK